MAILNFNSMILYSIKVEQENIYIHSLQITCILFVKLKRHLFTELFQISDRQSVYIKVNTQPQIYDLLFLPNICMPILKAS